MSEELKPCPCCGSDEIAEGYDTEGNSAFTCEGCGLGTAWEPTAVSRAAWNRRAPMTAPTPAGEEMEKLLERAREIAADDVSAMTASWVDTQAFARALISFPRVEEVRREALEKAAEQFEFYALEHRQKSLNSRGNGLDAAADASHEKAIINMGMANMCRSALSLQVEGTKP